MPKTPARGRTKRIFWLPLVLLLLLVILVYNPVTVRVMTVGVAAWYGLDARVFYRLIHTESRFRSFAVSRAAAIGLGQVRESTARYIHVKHRRGMLFLPLYNLRMSARYIRYLQDRFGDNWSLVLAAYNWGENNVERRTGGLQIEAKADYRQLFADVPETYAYIGKILGPPKKP